MFSWQRGRSRSPYTAGQWNDMPCALHAKYVCQTACPVPPPSPPATTPAPPPVPPPEYQKLNRLDPGCPEEFEITTLEACRLVITSLVGTAFDQWPPYFSPGREGQPRGCSLSNWGMGGKKGQTLVWNEVAVGRGRHDLAPVCKWTGTPTPPEPAPAPVPDDRDDVTVTPEEWDYFLAFQESRARGFSCRCNSGTGGTDQCNEIEGASKHFYAPNPEKVTFDCKLWKAAYWHSEDQAIQGYCSHTARDPDGLSPRMRAGRVGAVGPCGSTLLARAPATQMALGRFVACNPPQATATACTICALKASPWATRHQAQDGMSGQLCTTVVATTSRTRRAASQRATPQRGIGSEHTQSL